MTQAALKFVLNHPAVSVTIPGARNENHVIDNVSASEWCFANFGTSQHANIGIKLHKLRSEWEAMNKQELEKIKTTSEIERLFQDQLLLGLQAEAGNREVRNKSKEIDFMGLTKNTLTLEKLILQLEVTDRHIKREEARVPETDGQLKKLEIERDRLRASLEHGRR